MQDNRKFVTFIGYNKNFTDIKKKNPLWTRKKQNNYTKAACSPFKSILGRMITKEVFYHTQLNEPRVHWPGTARAEVFDTI